MALSTHGPCLRACGTSLDQSDGLSDGHALRWLALFGWTRADHLAAIRLVHGSADRATSPAATERLYERLPNADKSFKLYDGYEHSEWGGAACEGESECLVLTGVQSCARWGSMRPTTRSGSGC